MTRRKLDIPDSDIGSWLAKHAAAVEAKN